MSQFIQKQELWVPPSVTEGGHRPTGVAEGGARPSPEATPKVPEPETVIRPARRRFTAAFKLSILDEIDRCQTSTERGAVMRREGLYSSQISEWRKSRSAGALSAFSKKLGRPLKRSPQEEQLELLKAENKRLQAKLDEAEMINDIQKKVSAILGIKIQKT